MVKCIIRKKYIIDINENVKVSVNQMHAEKSLRIEKKAQELKHSLTSD